MSTQTSTRRPIHRSVALLASAGATAALALGPSAGAHASVSGAYAAAGSASASYVGPNTTTGSCQLTAGVSDPIGQIHTNFTHGTAHSSVDLAATYTSSDNSADQVRMKGHIDTSMTLRRRHGDLAAFALTAGGTLSVKHTVAGSACHGSASVLAEVPQVLFTESERGYLYLTRDTKKPNSSTTFILVNLKTQAAVALDVFAGTKSHVTSRALLKPGNYEIEETSAGLAIGNQGIFRSAPLSRKAAQTIHLKGTFKPVKH